MQAKPVQIQVNVSNYILALLKYMLELLKNYLVLIKITLYFDNNNLYISNNTLYFNKSQLSCREIQIHVFSILSINLLCRNFITYISTRVSPEASSTWFILQRYR